MFDIDRFNACLSLRRMSKRELAKRMNMNEATLYRKINRGGDFSRQEINDMIKILRIENPDEVFFTDELANTQV